MKRSCPFSFLHYGTTSSIIAHRQRLSPKPNDTCMRVKQDDTVTTAALVSLVTSYINRSVSRDEGGIMVCVSTVIDALRQRLAQRLEQQFGPDTLSMMPLWHSWCRSLQQPQGVGADSGGVFLLIGEDDRVESDDVHRYSRHASLGGTATTTSCGIREGHAVGMSLLLRAASVPVALLMAPESVLLRVVYDGVTASAAVRDARIRRLDPAVPLCVTPAVLKYVWLMLHATLGHAPVAEAEVGGLGRWIRATDAAWSRLTTVDAGGSENWLRRGNIAPKDACYELAVLWFFELCESFDATDYTENDGADDGDDDDGVRTWQLLRRAAKGAAGQRYLLRHSVTEADPHTHTEQQAILGSCVASGDVRRLWFHARGYMWLAFAAFMELMASILEGLPAVLRASTAQGHVIGTSSPITTAVGGVRTHSRRDDPMLSRAPTTSPIEVDGAAHHHGGEEKVVSAKRVEVPPNTHHDGSSDHRQLTSALLHPSYRVALAVDDAKQRTRLPAVSVSVPAAESATLWKTHRVAESRRQLVCRNQQAALEAWDARCAALRTSGDLRHSIATERHLERRKFTDRHSIILAARRSATPPTNFAERTATPSTESGATDPDRRPTSSTSGARSVGHEAARKAIAALEQRRRVQQRHEETDGAHRSRRWERIRSAFTPETQCSWMLW